MLPLSLSYDHRIIDGAEAARFNNDLKENLGKNFAYKLASLIRLCQKLFSYLAHYCVHLFGELHLLHKILGWMT